MISLYLHGTEGGISAESTMQYGLEYLHIMMLGLIPFAFTQIYAGTLREMGESLKPMVAGIASVVIDIVFNYCLIYGNFGFPRLGVKGAAIATVMARIVEMLTVILWTHLTIRRYRFLQGVYQTICVRFDEIKIILVKGLPIFFE